MRVPAAARRGNRGQGRAGMSVAYCFRWSQLFGEAHPEYAIGRRRVGDDEAERPHFPGGVLEDVCHLEVRRARPTATGGVLAEALSGHREVFEKAQQDVKVLDAQAALL